MNTMKHEKRQIKHSKFSIPYIRYSEHCGQSLRAITKDLVVNYTLITEPLKIYSQPKKFMFVSKENGERWKGDGGNSIKSALN